MKTFSSQHIQDKYNKKLTKDQKLEVLYEALDYMQQYNGRTKFECIALAMGFEEYMPGIYKKQSDTQDKNP